MSNHRMDPPERPSQLDRIEARLEELVALLRPLFGDQAEEDRAREGFRTYRKRMMSK